MRRKSVAVGVCLLAALTLTGCVGGAEPVPEEPTTAAGILEGDVGEQTELGDEEMPQECATVSVGWYPGVDVASLGNMPGDWPAPPAESTLCSTVSGSSIETAAYASPLGIDDVFAFYEAALPAAYESERLDGDDTGTGYASLTANGPGLAFEVRENDGGFTLAFANETE